jgi:hypothetical protein
VVALNLGTGGNNIAANTGTVMVLESPDMLLPVGIHARHRSHAGTRANSISRYDLLHSGKYELLTLNGRPAAPDARGIFLAREKGSAASPRLVTVVD